MNIKKVALSAMLFSAISLEPVAFNLKALESAGKFLNDNKRAVIGTTAALATITAGYLGYEYWKSLQEDQDFIADDSIFNVAEVALVEQNIQDNYVDTDGYDDIEVVDNSVEPYVDEQVNNDAGNNYYYPDRYAKKDWAYGGWAEKNPISAGHSVISDIETYAFEKLGEVYSETIESFENKGHEGVQELIKEMIMKDPEAWGSLIEKVMGKAAILAATVPARFYTLFEDLENKIDAEYEDRYCWEAETIRINGVCDFILLIAQENKDLTAFLINPVCFGCAQVKQYLNTHPHIDDHMNNINLDDSINDVFEVFADLLPETQNMVQDFADYCVWQRSFLKQQLQEDSTLQAKDLFEAVKKFADFMNFPKLSHEFWVNWFSEFEQGFAELPLDVQDQIMHKVTAELVNEKYDHIASELQEITQLRKELARKLQRGELSEHACGQWCACQRWSSCYTHSKAVFEPELEEYYQRFSALLKHLIVFDSNTRIDNPALIEKMIFKN